MRKNIDFDTTIDHEHPSHVPKPNMNPSPLTVHEGADTTLIMGETAQPRGFVGHQRIPDEGYHRAPGGPTRDIFKVGDGKVDMGEGIITVNKAGGGQEKKPLKTGPKGGKYYEEGGRKIYVTDQSGRGTPPYRPPEKEAPDEGPIDWDALDEEGESEEAEAADDAAWAAEEAAEEAGEEPIGAPSTPQPGTPEWFDPNESDYKEYLADRGMTEDELTFDEFASLMEEEQFGDPTEEPTRAPSEGGEPTEPTGDWSDRYGDIVASHRMALTPPEDVAVENYIASLDEAPSPGDKQESYMNFSQALQDEGWDTVEAYELATKLYRAHMDQGTKSEDDPPEDDDDVKKAPMWNTCLYCKGAGKTDAGSVCPICHGRGKTMEKDDATYKKVQKTIDEMVEAGEIDAKDKEKVLPAVLAGLARLGSKAIGAATKTPGRALLTGTVAGQAINRDDDKKGSKEILERVVGVQEELPATVARQVSTRADEQSGEAAAESAAAAAALIASRGKGKDKAAMQEMHEGVRKHGRVTFRKMCEDRAKTLTNILEKSDISALNVMKEMGVDESSLSDEIAKAEYMVEVLHGN